MKLKNKAGINLVSKDEIQKRFSDIAENKKYICSLDLELEHNAIPYVRTTQKQKWVSKPYKRYQEWKERLYIEFIKQNKKAPINIFKPKKKYFLDCFAVHKNLSFADGDNILKGVNDALFKDDKYNSGKFDYMVIKGVKARLIINFYECEDYNFYES